MQNERHFPDNERYDEVTLAGLVARAAARAPARVARLNGGPRRGRTYGALWEKSQRLAAGLAALGFGAGDRMALVACGEPEHTEAMVACSLLGAVFVTLDADDALVEALTACHCTAAMVADYALEPITEARDQLESLKWVVGVSTRKGKATPAQLQARGVRPYAELLVPDLASFAFAGSQPDATMHLVFRSKRTPAVVTHREYFESAFGRR